MTKAVVTDDTFDWGDDRPPNVPWSDTVIYEAHLRGMTRLREDIRAKRTWHVCRAGRPGGDRSPAPARHHRDRADADPRVPAGPPAAAEGPDELLGLQHAGFFALEPPYLSDGSRNEMRMAVRRLHAAGIEVILDVVYNHTAEGSELGPTLSFRGLDNASYYRLVPDNPRHCINDTGTGNTLNLSLPRVLQMVMDSLRYWVTIVPRRRVSLRSRRDAGPRVRRFRSRRRLLRRTAAGSGPVTGQADRRTMGHRPGRLPTGQSSARLRRME